MLAEDRLIFWVTVTAVVNVVRVKVFRAVNALNRTARRLDEIVEETNKKYLQAADDCEEEYQRQKGKR